MHGLTVDAKAMLSGLELLEAAIVQAAGFAMRDAVKATEASAKGTTLFHDRSGGGVTRPGEGTRSSIRGEVVGYQSGFVTAGGAARLLDSGTRAHVIHGNPFLAFQINGSTVVRRLVHHPGTAPRPFMRQARAVGEQVLDYAAAFYIGEAIRRVR
jgi:hypothetical protein